MSKPADQDSEATTEDLSPPLEPLLERARARGFFGLVALLERLAPNAAPIGGIPRTKDRAEEKRPPSEEPIRFRHDASLAFSTCEVSAVRVLEDRERHAEESRDADARSEPRFEVTARVLGLTGSNAPLPSYVLEEAAEDSDQGDARRAFLDVFHHRLLSLLYRAVKKHDFAGEHASDAGDAWSQRILLLAGAPPNEESSLPPRALLRLAPLLAAGDRRSAHALESALRDSLSTLLREATLEVRQFVPSWVELAEEDLTRLGKTNSHLSKSALLGRRICDRSAKVEIVIGPLDYTQYVAFLPRGEGYDTVGRVIAALGQHEFEYDLDLVILCSELPEVRLSARSTQELGRDTWLRGLRKSQDTLEVRVPLRADRDRASVGV